MTTSVATVESATVDAIVIRFDIRVTPQEYFRGRHTAIDEGAGFYVIQRNVHTFSWAELEQLARNTPDTTQRAMYVRLLEKARVKCPERKLRSTILDTTGESRPTNLYRFPPPQLASSKLWDTVATIKVSVASDGTWCALIDVSGTTDMGITREASSPAGLGKLLGQSLGWAYEKKRGKKPQRKRKPRPKALPKPKPALRALPPPREEP